MTKNVSEASFPSDTEIMITRVVNAPRELVWKVWSEPRHLAEWYGPAGFTTTTKSMEMKSGGSWKFTMHGPDGRDYENLISYLEIRELDKIVYKHGGAGDTEAIHFQTTVTFEVAQGNKTKVTMRSQFPSKEARDFVINTYGAIEGGKQNLARLDAYLETQQLGVGEAQDGPFVITRVVRAPRELVWKVWTELEHLLQWFGPKGMSIAKATIDLRPGGAFHYAMQTPDGKSMWGRWLFQEIQPPEKLVILNSFSDEAGGVSRAPFHPHWPLETLSTMTLENHAGLGKGTVIRLVWEPHNATAEERAVFAASHSSLNQGWGGTFAQLDDYLAKIQPASL